MTYTGPNATEAVQSIQDQVLGNKDRGYAVASPGSTIGTGAYAVTVNTGTLDATDTLSVGSTNDEIIFNGASASLSAATDIGIDSVPTAGDGTKQYRYDTIWADVNGEVNITKGTVTKVPTIESQNNLTRFERLKADIPLPGTWPSVVICAVVTNSDDTSVGSSQLRDYRVDGTQKVKALEADDTNSKRLSGDRHHVNNYDGVDADTRLDNALSAASSNDLIILGDEEYSDNRTISTPHKFRGQTSDLGGTRISGDWTCDARVSIESVAFITNTITFNGRYSSCLMTPGNAGSSITVDANNVRLLGLTFSDVTFTSNSSAGIVDASSGVSVTDNGTNTVGDIA